jgi:hypothetical protein
MALSASVATGADPVETCKTLMANGFCPEEVGAALAMVIKDDPCRLAHIGASFLQGRQVEGAKC